MRYTRQLKMVKINKNIQDLAINGGLILGGVVGVWYAYDNNFFGLKDLFSSVKSGAKEALNFAQNPPPPANNQGTGAFQPQTGFESGYNPNLPSVPPGAPGVDYTGGDIYQSPSQFLGGAVDPISGIDYSFYPYATGVGTLPGTNPTPYPNPCIPGYYRASDLKCYPIPTEFPGSGCGPGRYLANDGICYNYPGQGSGPTYQPVPCPVGEYRASDGKCYALPTPPPESCPVGWYRASDGQCYRTNPQDTSDPTCPTGFTLGSDGICRPTNPGTTPPIQCPAGYELVNNQCIPSQSPQCPTGYVYSNGVCIPATNPCPTGYNFQNGVCVPSTGNCPAGYIFTNGVCVPAPTGSPLNIPIGKYTLIKPLAPGDNPGNWTESIIKREPYKINVDFWTAVMMRPQFSGGVPRFAVIIEADDKSEMIDAMSRAGFVPLTPDILFQYQEIPGAGGFMATALVANGRRRRRLNR